MLGGFYHTRLLTISVLRQRCEVGVDRRQVARDPLVVCATEPQRLAPGARAARVCPAGAIPAEIGAPAGRLALRIDQEAPFRSGYHPHQVALAGYPTAGDTGALRLSAYPWSPHPDTASRGCRAP